MHERDTRSPTVAEPAGALRAPALRPIEAAVLKLQRDVGNRVTAGIVSSKLGRPRADQRPPGAADFARLLGDQAATFGQFACGDRDVLLAQLAEEGDRRRSAQASERAAVEVIAKLIPQALNSGISKREISRRTGLSRPWIDELLQRHSSDTQL